MDLLGWVIFIVALLVSVMLHETGHFILAKRFGMKVTATSSASGHVLVLPGAVRPSTDQGTAPGRLRQDRRHALAGRSRGPGRPARSFRSKPAWQRIAVLVPLFMHFLLAFLLIGGLALGVGIANDNVTQLGTISSCVPANLTAYDNSTCVVSDAASPAKQAGLQVGKMWRYGLRRPSGEHLDPARQRDQRRPARPGGHHHRPARRPVCHCT